MAVFTRNLTSAGTTLSPLDERWLFGSLQHANGVYKITRANRFDDLNAVVAAAWKSLGARPKIVLDAGASSGISSLEWADALTAEGFATRVVASDILLKARVVGVAPGLGLLVDEGGSPLHHVVFGRLLFRRSRWRERLTGIAVIRTAIDRLVKLRRIHLARGGRPIMLANATAVAHPMVEFAEDDVFASPAKEFEHRFDAIRVANLLTLTYFGHDDLRRGIEGLRRRLAGAGSFLIVARSGPGRNHGTVFRLNDADRFDVVTRLGSGSELEDLVLRTAA